MSRRDIFNFWVFFHIQSYLLFEKCIWNHFHIKCEDLETILDFSFPYKKKKIQNSKNVAPGHFNFLVFFHIQSYLLFEKCIWNHFHIKCEDLKAILDFSFAYKKKKVQNSKNVAPGHFRFFCFFSCSIISNICKMHLESFSYQIWKILWTIYCLQKYRKW